MSKKSVIPISISKTAGEWEIINQKISESGKENLSEYIRGEVRKLQIKFRECPECITPATGGTAITKRPYIPIYYYAEIKLIALRMSIPVSSVIDELIISPLLQDSTPKIKKNESENSKSPS
jgi:hypothetical protein